MYTLHKFHFLNGISEINTIFDDILIIWPAPVYIVMAKNIGTLGKYDQRQLWKLICIVNPFDLLFKKKWK